MRVIDVSQSEVNSTTEAFDIALSLGATQEPYVVHRDVTAILPVLDIGDPGTFGVNLPYPGGYGLPGDEAHFVVAAYANMTIPAGRWQIAFGSDDGGAISLSGVNFFDEFGENGTSQQILLGDGTLRYEAPRGHQWTGATLQLDQPLTAALSGVFFEEGGQDSFEIAIRDASAVSLATLDPAEGWTLLGDGALGWQVSTDVLAGRRIGGQSLIGGESLLVRHLENAVEGIPVQQSGLFADIYHGNLDSVADWDTVLSDQPFPMSQGTIPNVNWASHNRAIGGGGYPSAFGFDNPENREAYSVRAHGELFIGESGTVRFKDGTDDYSYLAVDLDGDGLINSPMEVLINDDGAAGVTGAGNPIAIADFTNVDAGGEYRLFDYRMAEDAGFDAGVLYWDQNVGAPAFPSTPSTAARPEHLVPASAFRTTMTPIASGDLVAGIDPGLPLVFDIDADSMTADQVSLPPSPDPARFRNVLDVDGASLIVELLAGTLEPGDAFDLVDEVNIDEILGTPVFQFPYGDWDTSSFASDGRITFLSGSIDPPDEMPQTAWNKPAGGNWTEPTNWDAGVPNAVGDVAIFNSTAPTTSATIVLDAPVQVEAVQSASPRAITIAGDGALVFAPSAAGTAHIKVTSATGALTIGTAVQFPDTTLIIEPERTTTTVRLDGGIHADSGDIVKNGAGNLVLAGDNGGWNGALLVNSGRVEGRHANAFGSSAAATTIDGGRIDVKSATSEPFLLREGALHLAAPSGQITLESGTVTVEQDVPLDFVVNSANGGDVLFNKDQSSGIQLHGAAPTAGDNKIKFVGGNTEPFEFETKRISGPITGGRNPLTIQLAGGPRSFLHVSAALLAEEGIAAVEAVEGFSILSGNNTYGGKTIVRSGARLSAQNENSLGAADGTAATATIVERGGRLTGTFGGISPNELVILNGGALSGEILGTVHVAEDSLVMSGGLEGTLTGPGGITFVGSQDGSFDVTQLHTANTYTGRSIIAMPDGGLFLNTGSVEVFHPQAFGESADDPLLVSGEVHLHTELDRPLVAEGGRVVVQMPTFTGDVLLQGGGVSTDEDPIDVNTTLQLNGGTSQLSGRQGRLYIHEPIQGHGDLIVGQRHPNDPADGNVTFNAPPEFDGNLIVTRPGVEFNVAPQISGSIVLSRTLGGFIGGATFNVDATANLLFRGGELRTAEDTTVTSLNPTLTMQSGGINGNIAGVEQIVVDGAGEVLLQSIGNSDAELVVRNGLVRSEGQRGLGSTSRGVVVESSRNAALHIEIHRDEPVVSENIRLNNAGGRNFEGGLILEASSGDIPVTYEGMLDLGQQGSVVQVIGENVFNGQLLGGDLTLVGGELQLATNAEHTGKTKIGTDAAGGFMQVFGGGALQSTSAIVLSRGSIFELDRVGLTTPHDQVGDAIPITLRGGSVRLRGSRPETAFLQELLGSVALERGESRLDLHGGTIQGESSLSLSVSSITRNPGASVVFAHTGDFTIGEDRIESARIHIQQRPSLVRGILGGWAIVHEDNLLVADFATYDLEGDRGVFALSRDGRPSQINGAGPNDHVLVRGPVETLAQDTSIASLMVIDSQTSGTDIDLGGRQLVVETGGILASSASFNLLNGSIAAGNDADSGDLVFTTIGGDSHVHAAIVDGPVDSVSLVKAGGGTLHLYGPSTYSGDTFVNRGRLTVHSATALPQTTHLVVAGGDFIPENAISRVSSLTLYNGVVTGVAADSVALFGGFLDLTDQGTSVEKLGPAKSYLGFENGFSGTLHVREGILELENIRQGTGDIFVHDGAVLEFPFGFRNQDPFTADMELAGGLFQTLGASEQSPVTLSRPMRITGNSEIAVTGESFRQLLLAGGLVLNESVRLTRTGTGVMRIAGNMVIDSEATLQLDAGETRLEGSVQAADGAATLYLNGPASSGLPDAASLVLAGDNRQFSGNFDIQSLTVHVANSNALGMGTTTLLPDSSLILEIDNVTGNIVLDGGQLVTQSDSQFIGTITNASELSPGASPGRLGVDGSFLQDEAGRLVMEIASPVLVGSLYDHQADSIEATQQFRADGELIVRLLHGFSPSEGETFDLFDFGSLEGQFDSIHLPALDANLTWETSRLYIAGELSVVRQGFVRGDYNSDAMVDQSDLDLVLLNWGAPAQTPPTGWTSDLPSGLVDQDELDGVLLHWGTGTSGGGINEGGAVPEPTTLAMLLVGLAGMLAAMLLRATQSR